MRGSQLRVPTPQRTVPDVKDDLPPEDGSQRPHSQPDLSPTATGGDGAEAGGARADDAATARSKPGGLWPKVKEVLVVLFWALLIAFLVKTFLFRGFYIPSGSMENTLELNDRIFVNVAGSYLSDPERGDIVVFEDTQNWVPHEQTDQNPVRRALSFIGVMPDSSQNYLIKRVIGQGGDTVTCDAPEAKVKVNGQVLDESVYLPPDSEEVPCGRQFEVTVPEGHYFMMGDHRVASADSRYHLEEGTAFISEDSIVGEAAVIAWPVSRWTILDDHEEVFSSVPAP